MPAPEGNQYWKVRSSHGREPVLATADDLWHAAVTYFEWIDANSLQEEKVFHLAFSMPTSLPGNLV